MHISVHAIAVCRALGIPARTVTNFSSGHDSDGSITIDTYYDCQGKRLREERFNQESVW